jgi:NAD(P)-dependent dehydrogenase (short-subunit alcohol dehydrogenase family)
MGQFTRESTTDEVLAGIDLSGKRVLITGSSGGLGEESTRALAAAGASVTMAARDSSKNAAAAARVRASVPTADLELRELDLADLASVGRFTDGFVGEHARLDVLIDNAGVMVCPEGRTADGFERQFGTNHLGHFLLTCRLVPVLLASAPARVVVLSSGGHSTSGVDFDDPNFEARPYDPWLAYGQSKSANALFALELDRRLSSSGVQAFSVHPGMIMTDLGRHMTPEMLKQMGERTKKRAEAAGEEPAADIGSMFKAVEAGAATQVWAATAAELTAHGGTYLADCQLGERGGNPSKRGMADHILDAEAAARLWTLSEDLVGETFDF